MRVALILGWICGWTCLSSAFLARAQAEGEKAAEPRGKPAESSKEASKGPSKESRQSKAVAKAPPLVNNLTLPEDLTPEAHKAVEEAVKSFQEAEKSTAGASRLMAQAIAKLRTANQRWPKCALPLHYLGVAYKSQRNLTQARASLEKALKLNPKLHESMVELGEVCALQKKLKDALTQYDKALALEPRYALAYESKAMAQIELCDFAAAKQSLLEANKLDKGPKSIERQLYIAEIDREIKGPGWKSTYTAETENYRVMTSVSDEFAREIAHNAELIRKAYNVVFSDIPKPDRKYVIWAYESVEAYHKAGGPEMAAGHYAPIFRKLVVPKQKNKALTYTVLYHEAFHQYLHDYLELAPQWFNEGLGDYFGAYEYRNVAGKESMVSKPSAMRLGNVQFAIRTKVLPSAADLMHMSQQEMYDPQMGALHYAEAWAIIYFCIEGNRPEYKRVLIAYFSLLRKGKDRTEAFDQSFGKLDMNKFDLEWKGFIQNLSGN